MSAINFNVVNLDGPDTEATLGIRATGYSIGYFSVPTSGLIRGILRSPLARRRYCKALEAYFPPRESPRTKCRAKMWTASGFDAYSWSQTAQATLLEDVGGQAFPQLMT